MHGNLLLEYDLQKGGPTLHSKGSRQSFCHQSQAGQGLVHTMFRAMLTWISLYRASLHSPLGPTMEGSSILLTATMIFVTPSVLASCACSRVWPPRSKPASNSACATSQCRCKLTRITYDQKSWLASCCAAISGCCSYVLACSGRQSGCAFLAAIFMAASKMRHYGRR